MITEVTNIAGVQKENTIADTAVKQATAKMQEVAARVANDTEKQQIDQITYAANEQIQRAREQFNKAQVAEETQRDQIKKIKHEAQNEILKGAAIRQGIQLDQAKIKKLTEAMLWGAGINAAGNLVKGFMDLRTGGLTTTTTETKK